MTQTYSHINAYRYAPIDNSDASGMNMMDISCNTWSTACLDAVTSGSSTVDAANLREKLGEVSLAHVVCGQVSTYLQSRYELDFKYKL